MGNCHTSRRRAKVITLEELVDVCKLFNGNRKHDWDVGEKAGISHVHTDVLRYLLGKIQYSAMDIDQKTKEDIVECYNNGMPILDIAKRHELNGTSYIYKIIKQMGGSVDRAESWSPIKISSLFQFKDVKKYTWQQVASVIGKSPNSCIYKYHHIKNTCKSMATNLQERISFGTVHVKYDTHKGICATCNTYVVPVDDIPEDINITEEWWKENSVGRNHEV